MKIIAQRWPLRHLNGEERGGKVFCRDPLLSLSSFLPQKGGKEGKEGGGKSDVRILNDVYPLTPRQLARAKG